MSSKTLIHAAAEKASFDVFISYSSLDKQIADAVKHGLHCAGIRCWMAPDDITPGKDWAAEIIFAIEQCPIMVLIWTKSSMSSLEVPKELGLAMSSGSIVIPFRLENIQPEGSFKYHLSGRHWLDVYDKNLDQAIDELTAQTNASLKKPRANYLGSTRHTSSTNLFSDEPLQGEQLITRIKTLSDISISELVRACGYACKSPSGRDFLRFNAFYNSVAQAKGLALLQARGISAPGTALTSKPKDKPGLAVTSNKEGSQADTTSNSEPLVGDQLIAKVKEMVGATKSDLARSCGYVGKKRDGSERINFRAFYYALLEAKGLQIDP